MDADEEVGWEGGGGEVIAHEDCQFTVNTDSHPADKMD